MTKKTINIEIQAPGKNPDFAREAIKCGADSVYIGAAKYSMRYEYGNDLDELKKLIDYAHKYWVKIYIPVNCLLFSDKDLQEMKTLIWNLYELGADAVIIQDIGILELDLPPIPIFLSTNTACFTKEVCKFYKDIGVYRIILPRELTYNEIREIAEYSKIDLETFCYGYLCVGYSGKCYLAYTENLSQGKTVEFSHYHAANHGVCSEHCMSYYDLFDADGNLIVENDRLLNLKFLNLSDETIKLVDAGVYSFKIAGREKDLKHAKNSTAKYSAIANDVVAKRNNVKRLSSGRCILGFKPDFTKSFTKGLTDFFFYGRKHELYSKNHLVGTNVGKVIEFKNNSFKLDSDDYKLAKGDKLRYKIADKPVQTLEIVKSKGSLYFCNPIKDDINGLELYRYINVKGFKEVENSVNYRVISVTLNILKNENKYLVKATDEDKNSICVDFEIGKRKIAKKNIKKKLFSVSEDCEFVIDKVKTKEDLYLNNIEEFKSLIFEKLRAERAKNRPVLRCEIKKNNIPYPYKNLNYMDNVTNKLTEQFYKRHGVESIEQPLETRKDIEGLRVLNSKYCLKYELGYCSKTKPQNIPKEPWTLKNKVNGNKFKVECDCKKCEMHLLYEK